MFKVDTSGYSYLVLGAIFLAPICWAISTPSVFSVMAAALIIYSVLVTMYYCHVDGMSFAQALGAMSAKYSSGCANITILYIWIIVLVYLVYGMYLTAFGMIKGRSHSRDRWLHFLNSQLR